MCINPSSVWVERGPEWVQEPVACRRCWRCKKNRVNDYVARSLCEASTSVATCAITLTYAPRDDLADKVLDPRHFQLFMKLLRRSGHSVRYLVAGEYGKLRDRAHFHAILFFSELAEKPGPAPAYNWGHLADQWSSAPFSASIPSNLNVHIREWPHGHVFADWSADEKAIRYVCKYLLHEDKKSAWFSLSKKPALGAEWFAQKAQRALDLHVLPSSFEYLPPGGDRNKSYMMTGATRRDYLAAVTAAGADRSRMSEWVQKSYDKQERQKLIDEIDARSPADIWADKEAEAEHYEDVERRVDATRRGIVEDTHYLYRDELLTLPEIKERKQNGKTRF